MIGRRPGSFGRLSLRGWRYAVEGNLRIFKAPNLAAGNLALLLLSGGWIPLWYFLNLYLQQVLQYSAFAGGLALLPMTILIAVFMMFITGKLIALFGLKANLVAGLTALGGAMLLFAGNTPVDGTFAANVLPASLLGALGMSLAYIPATMAAMSGAKPEEALNAGFQSAFFWSAMVSFAGAALSLLFVRNPKPGASSAPAAM